MNGLMHARRSGVKDTSIPGWSVLPAPTAAGPE